jgi:hypothetical protein
MKPIDRWDQAAGDFLVVVLSETVLVLELERTQMTEPVFDHERLDLSSELIRYRRDRSSSNGL